MTKSFMQVTAIVPTGKMHDLDAALEDCDGMQVMWRPYRNGHDAPRAAKPKRQGNIKKMSEQQQTWLAAWFAKNVDEQVNLPEIKKAWVKTDFRPTGIHGALATAIRLGTVKKVKPGVYKPGKALSNG
jgi:hypothetical protein